MLTLILVRHGEATPFSSSGDHGRELTDHGVEQAKAAGELIRGWGFAPSLCVSSDAARAVQTTACVSAACGVRRTVYSAMLYGSYTTNELIEAVATSVNEADGGVCDCVVVVGHNPDMTYKADALSREPLQAAFPVAGAVVLLFDVNRWDEVTARSGTILRSSFL